jgi:hypothetical protein
MSQRWEDLLLLHWPVSPSVLQPTLPRDLEVDLFEGSAWISVVGFKLTQLRISPFRWIRWPDFWEINLRTYICNQQGDKGVWFYSLDSSDLPAVMGARTLYGLPYNFARTEGVRESDKISFQSNRRIPHHSARARFGASFSSFHDGTDPARSRLDRFLLERYRFWSSRQYAGFSSSAQVMHTPYDAVRTVQSDYRGELFSSQGLDEPVESPVIGHYCPGFNVQASAPAWAFSIAGQANQR